MIFKGKGNTNEDTKRYENKLIQEDTYVVCHAGAHGD